MGAKHSRRMSPGRPPAALSRLWSVDNACGAMCGGSSRRAEKTTPSSPTRSASGIPAGRPHTHEHDGEMVVTKVFCVGQAGSKGSPPKRWLGVSAGISWFAHESSSLDVALLIARAGKPCT
jgi:hypothetical protein